MMHGPLNVELCKRNISTVILAKVIIHFEALTGHHRLSDPH